VRTLGWLGFGLALWAGPLAAQQRAVQQLAAWVRDGDRDAAERCALLGELQDRAALDVPTVLAALGDPDPGLGMAAAAILRHEWAELPEALFAALDERPAAASALLRELAIAPRPAAAGWAQRWLQRPSVSADLRCLALAASGRTPGPGDGELLLATLAAGEADDGFHAAVALLPAPVADLLLGKLHALLASGRVDVAQALPLLDRLSDQGTERLLGLAVTLPGAAAAQLCQRLVQRRSPAYAARAAAALDGSIPLEPLWLLQAGPLLDRQQRRERLLALLGETSAGEPLRAAAFDALVDAAVVDDRLLDFAQDGDLGRLGKLDRVLDAAVAHLPEVRLVAWLGSEPELALKVVQALVRRPALGERLEAALLQPLLDSEVIAGLFLEGAALVLLQSGSEATVARLWPALRAAPGRLGFLDALARRRAPFVRGLLLADLAALAGTEPVREAERDAVRLALCAAGDRRGLAELVAHAAARDATFVRRCVHFASPLDERSALHLLDAAVALSDEDLAGELIAWAATADAPAVHDRLRALWLAGGGGERQEAALRGLAAGPHRADLRRQLRAALAAGPLSDLQESLAFEVVAALPQPPGAADLELLADLVLRAPLADAEGEAARARRWPDGRAGFPLVAAVARQLRGADPAAVAAAFAGVAADVRRDPRHVASSRQRLLVLWRSLEAEAELQAAAGAATAELLLAIPDTAGLGDGPAHGFALRAATARGEHGAAAAHGRLAVALLLRLPAARRDARLFLGERDPAGGVDAWAALAAAPHLARARSARGAGDLVRAREAAALAAEFAGRDAAARAQIDTLMLELSR